ncbi:hypothetical protein B0T24DRAFT_591433 [Lasiosphaeria ovina]|uniref:Uncharacterized protein n=1 Tax=Lasiosphaeria ovina TaxID=92902 RepID=A0AAE0KGD4_9PEZI|nr:hypothetical protein B0T24DRAFT_591433 [Lasiosphaeria ovina]
MEDSDGDEVPQLPAATPSWRTRAGVLGKNLNMLLGFAHEIGHNVNSIAESIMEHAIEEEGGPADPAPDLSELAIVAGEVVRRTQDHDGFDYDAEMEDEGESNDG